MKVRSLAAAAILGLAFLLSATHAAGAAEIRVLSAVGLKAIMEDLGPKFEHETGNKLTIAFATLGDAVKRIRGGETADVVIILRQGFDTLAKDGKASADSVTVLASTGIGVAVRKGAPIPDISSPEAFKRTLLAAKSITYSNPASGGASGIHFAKVLERLGITNEMKPKTVFPAKPDEAGLLVADGVAEIGVTALQVLVPIRGIDIVGPLPGDLQDTAVLVAVIMPGVRDAEAARALIAFLRTPDAAAVIKAKGMEPAPR